MNNPLVTIGLPVVKSSFLKKSIECCLFQSHKNLEIIIQNNAKNENIKSEIRDLVSEFNDERLKYFETKVQLPMVQNWNSILQKANGDLFSILCDDDVWEPTFIEEMVLLSIENRNTSLFHSRVAKIDENDNIISISNNCPNLESGIDFIFHRLNGARETYLSDFLVKTVSLKEIGGFIEFPDGWGSDTFTWFKISLKGGIAYSSKVLFNYRVSHLNTTNSRAIKNKFLAIDQQYYLIQNLIFEGGIHNDKYESVFKVLLNKLNKEYADRCKKNIVLNLLIVNFKLPMAIAQFISLIYFYNLKRKNK